MDANDWDTRYAASELVWGAEPNRWLVAEAAHLPRGRALDLACGEGRNALWLAARGWQVTGVDFSGVALSRAGDRAAQAGCADRVTWVEADVLDAQRWGGPFDLVLIAYLHLPAAARRAAHRSAVSVLGPAGRLLVIAHDLSNLTGGVGGPQDPSVLFTPQDVVADLEDVSGLVVERAEQVRRPVATPEGDREAVDLLVRIVRT